MSLRSDLEQIMIKELDRVSDEAVTIMRAESPQKGKNPWTTGALAASVHKETVDKFTRTVGSDLEYAKYVQNGRGPVYPKPDNPWGAVYLKGLNVWRPAAGSAPAQHVVEKTLAKLK